LASPVQQVFISYAIEDADFAQRLADDLKRLGARVWIAPESILPGESWIDAIERGLGESSHVVMVLTPAALEASGVKMERDMAITLALQDQIAVISLRVKPCKVPLVLSRYQMIVAFQEDYEAGLNQLAGHLGLQVAPPEAEGIEKADQQGSAEGGAQQEEEPDGEAPEEVGDYIYEPDREALLEKLLPRYVEVQLFWIMLEAQTSEFAARMTAMDNATSNAKEMIERLTLTFNRARQAAITKELMDIVNGAEALQ